MSKTSFKIILFGFHVISQQNVIFFHLHSSDGNKIFISNRMHRVIKTKYTLISATPTLRFKVYFAYDITEYRTAVANSSDRIVYSMSAESSAMKERSESLRWIILRMSHGKPSDIIMASELAPSELDTPTPPSPARKITINVFYMKFLPLNIVNARI